MHPICPAQKRIENNFTSIVEELFTKMAGADQAAVVRENSIKSEKKKKKIQDLWEYMQSSISHFIKNFPLSLGD